MSGEPKDQAIKLFGKTILLPEFTALGSDSVERFEKTNSLHEEHINKDSEERENDQVRDRLLASKFEILRLTQILILGKMNWVVVCL